MQHFASKYHYLFALSITGIALGLTTKSQGVILLKNWSSLSQHHSAHNTRVTGKFASLHSHSTYSVFDGLGYPDEHIDSAYNRGLNGYALTDHGNMNGFSHAFIKAKKMAAEGKTDFKVIYGIEAYVHPSVNQW